MLEVYHTSKGRATSRSVEKQNEEEEKAKLIESQTVNHAGYQRYILERNPKRFNGYGDELDDSESDADADADAEEENAYGEVRIEGTLGA